MNRPVSEELASALLDAGKAIESAAMSGAILAREPNNAIAAHLLGLALKETGDLEQGEQWLRFSIRLEPLRAEFHSNLANLLRRAGKLFGPNACTDELSISRRIIVPRGAVLLSHCAIWGASIRQKRKPAVSSRVTSPMRKHGFSWPWRSPNKRA